MKIKDIWGTNKITIVIFILAMILATITIVAVIDAKRSTDEAAIITESTEINKANKQVVEDIIQLSIRQCENIRTYGNIITVQFEVFDTNTNNVCTLSDGVITVEDIKYALEEYLLTNRYKTISVGMVDNKFYIQQDTSVSIEDTQLVNVVSLNESFSADDWFSLTEATYNNTIIQADSLCRYQTADSDIRQYIYVYTEKK